MRWSIAALAAALVLAAVVLTLAFLDEPRTGREPATAPSETGDALSDAPRPAIDRPGGELHLSATGSPAGTARVEARPFRFEVAARGFRRGPEGIVLEGVTVRNATTAAAFDVRFYALGPGLAPGGERALIGDLDPDEASVPADLAFPLVLELESGAAAEAAAMGFYLAYRVAADEPTWLLSATHPIRLSDG